ncbi:MAG: hypothetical protein AAF988_01520 [Pseudomonadota bacterium]
MADGTPDFHGDDIIFWQTHECPDAQFDAILGADFVEVMAALRSLDYVRPLQDLDVCEAAKSEVLSLIAKDQIRQTHLKHALAYAATSDPNDEGSTYFHLAALRVRQAFRGLGIGDETKNSPANQHGKSVVVHLRNSLVLAS